MDRGDDDVSEGALSLPEGLVATNVRLIEPATAAADRRVAAQQALAEQYARSKAALDREGRRAGWSG